LADSYDRAIAKLQTGLEKNWTAEEYLAAAPATFTAKIMARLWITNNMQRAAQENRPAARVAFLARALLQSFAAARFSAAGSRRINCLCPLDQKVDDACLKRFGYG